MFVCNQDEYKHSPFYKVKISQMNKKRLDEVTRKNLVGKTIYQSKARYNKRKNYRVSDTYGIDVRKFIENDFIAIRTQVGDYFCIVAFEGVIEELIGIVQQRFHNNLTWNDTYKALYNTIDKGDIYVDCECADFRYRFSYWATRMGYKYGKPEKRPARITNPRNNIGSFCKHLTLLLANKRWLKKCTNVVHQIIKDNVEEIREIYHLDEEEFFINQSSIHLTKKQKNPHYTPPVIPEVEPTQDENEEETEPEDETQIETDEEEELDNEEVEEDGEE